MECNIVYEPTNLLDEDCVYDKRDHFFTLHPNVVCAYCKTFLSSSFFTLHPCVKYLLSDVFGLNPTKLSSKSVCLQIFVFASYVRLNDGVKSFQVTPSSKLPNLVMSYGREKAQWLCNITMTFCFYIGCINHKE